MTFTMQLGIYWFSIDSGKRVYSFLQMHTQLVQQSEIILTVDWKSNRWSSKKGDEKDRLTSDMEKRSKMPKWSAKIICVKGENLLEDSHKMKWTNAKDY